MLSLPVCLASWDFGHCVREEAGPDGYSQGHESSFYALGISNGTSIDEGSMPHVTKCWGHTMEEDCLFHACVTPYG